jgi:hypothetical protein
MLFGWILTVLPLAGYLIAKKVPSVHLVWPPLGSIEAFAAGLAMALTALFGRIPRLFRTKGGAKKAVVVAVLVAVVSLVAYCALLSKYVVKIETPNSGTQYRSIGSEVTPKARHMFPDEPPERILEIAGLDDADIEQMWTPSSVHRARLELFVSYLLCLAAINFAAASYARAS